SGEGKTEEVVKDELDEKEELVEEETAGVVGEVIASSEEIPPSTEGQVVPSQEKPKKAKVLATPVARKLAKDLGVDITKIKGTGPNGRIMKEDIYRAKEEMSKEVEKPKLPEVVEPTISGEEERIERIPLTRIRKT